MKIIYEDEDFISVDKINYCKFKELILNFWRIYDGLSRGKSTPQRKFLNFVKELEKIVFGEVKTKSWHVLV